MKVGFFAVLSLETYTFDMSNPAIPEHAKPVFSGEIFTVLQWEQELYDGSTATFEALDRPDTVHTVCVLDSGNLLLVEDEQPNRGMVLTPPGGRIDPGETPEEAATRETLEETGYEIGDLRPWHDYQVHSKIDWTVYAFIGRDCKKVAEQNLEPGEKVTLREFTFDEFLALGDEPLLRDNVIKIMLLQAQLDPKKKEALQALLYD